MCRRSKTVEETTCQRHGWPRHVTSRYALINVTKSKNLTWAPTLTILRWRLSMTDGKHCSENTFISSSSSLAISLWMLGLMSVLCSRVSALRKSFIIHCSYCFTSWKNFSTNTQTHTLVYVEHTATNTTVKTRLPAKSWLLIHCRTVVFLDQVITRAYSTLYLHVNNTLPTLTRLPAESPTSCEFRIWGDKLSVRGSGRPKSPSEVQDKASVIG